MIILLGFFSDENNCYMFGPLWRLSVAACSRSVSTCSRTLAWGPRAQGPLCDYVHPSLHCALAIPPPASEFQRREKNDCSLFICFIKST